MQRNRKGYVLPPAPSCRVPKFEPIRLRGTATPGTSQKRVFKMAFISSNRARRGVMAAFLLGAVALSLAGLNLVRQSLDGRLFDPTLLIALLPFAIWSFGLRALRWHA